MTIFGLLLLTGIAVAMMYSSDSETMIAVNYRDKQVATYAALSALEEARQRIHPQFGDLSIAGYTPTNIPSTSNGQVLYIINPNTANGETVASIAPWQYQIGGKVNPYFDAELCQENMLGLAGTRGVACTGTGAVPSQACSVAGSGGGGWCSYYDNSANATNWKLAAPLDYKWVRITLKEDWNTPMYVPSPLLASGKQVCWDGGYQNQIPVGYGTNCQGTSGNVVVGVNVTAAGTGYTSAPTVTISGGGGSGATAVANMGTSSTGTITSAAVTTAGSGYTTTPTVTVQNPDGSGATFQALISGAPISSVTMNNTGVNYCYTSGTTPSVSFTTSPTTNTLSNATGTVNMNTAVGCITTVQIPAGTCSKYKNSTQSMTSSPPGGGSGFSGSATLNSTGKITGITVSAPGSGYSSGSGTFTIGNGANACTYTTSFSAGSQISSITIAAGNGGSYMSQPTAALGGATPASPASGMKLPALTANWSSSGSTITGINVNSGGSGYLASSYNLIITGGGGTGAVATAHTATTNIVQSYTVTNAGGGYTTAPTVTLSGGGGPGATATATIASGGTSSAMGQIYLITSFAATRSASRSMAQMEAGVRPPFTFNLGGAITLAGPSPAFISPNSQNFTVNGNDANSCGQTASPAKPAIGVWDSTSQTSVINALGKPNNYVGAGGTPSVENVYASLGGADVTPANLNGFVQNLQSYATSPVLTGTVTTLPTTTSSSVTYIDGNLNLSGNVTGNGVLVITGTLTFSGNFTWNGIVLVVGQGQVVHNGGGNGNFNGAIYVAQTEDAAGNLLPVVPGQPQYTWNGGGVNSIQYDHCLADALLQKYNGQPSAYSLQVLSTRTLQY